MKNKNLISGAKILGVILFATNAFAISAKDDLLYDKMFPYYAEPNASSQAIPVEGNPGGPYGHAVIYIRGACKDYSANYPRLKMCDVNDANGGVGVSLDAVYENVKWVAIPDKNLFFNGGIPEDQKVTQDTLKAVAAEAIRLGVFKGVRAQSSYNIPAAEMESWLADEGMGTEYGLNLIRSFRGARIPLTQERVQAMVDYLNSENDALQAPGKKFVWNMLTDNCSHLVHNALAAAGLWGYQETNTSGPEKFLNLSIPMNRWVEAATAIHHEMQNPMELYRNSKTKAFVESGWLPAQAGALITDHPMHSFENEVAKKSSYHGITDMPVEYHFVANMYSKDPNFTDLKSNLLMYQKIYQSLAKKHYTMRDPKSQSPNILLSSKDFIKFLGEYDRYASIQLIKTNANLELMK